MEQLFSLGAVTISPGAQAALTARGVGAAPFLARHQRGDWGEVDDRDREENEFAVRHEWAIYAPTSIYTLDAGDELLIITAADRSWTRVLLDSEYEEREIDAREGYALWAATYARGHNPLIAVEEPHVDALTAALPIAVALDAGAGTGRHALKLARRGAAVTAIDQSREMLAVAEQAARAEALPIAFQVASLDEPLPFASGQFDFAICALVLSHVRDLAGAVREFGRVLQPGGHLLLTDFHPDAVGRGARTDFQRPGVTYLLPNLPHTRAGYLAALAAAGFTVRATIDALFREALDGFFTETMRGNNGDKPFCLIVLARKDVGEGALDARRQ